MEEREFFFKYIFIYSICTEAMDLFPLRLYNYVESQNSNFFNNVLMINNDITFLSRNR